MQRAGNKQQNGQNNLAHQSPSNQSGQKILGWLIFQSPENAKFNGAWPAALLSRWPGAIGCFSPAIVAGVGVGAYLMDSAVVIWLMAAFAYLRALPESWGVAS